MSIFIIFSASVSFWGRLLLSAIKPSERALYGQPFVFVTGLVAVVYSCCLLSGWTDNYSFLLNIIFSSGLIGFIIELLFLKIPIIIKIRKNKQQIITLLLKYKFFLGLIIHSIVLAFLYSAVWPSGNMETWLSNSSDFYYWPLMSDYLMGHVDRNVFSLGPDFFKGVYDSFGTHLIFGLFSFSSGYSALFSWPTLAVTFLVWSGATVQNLVARIFGFGFWTSLIVALGVVSGAFYNYVIAAGMLGQLIAMFCFLASLERVFKWGDVYCPGFSELKELFPPLFLIFLAYQGGYLVFAFMIGIVTAFTGFFNSKTDNLKKRITKCIIWGIYPILILTIVSSIFEPIIATHLFNRTFEVAAQEAGWTIPFLDPWLLSGVPIYKQGYFGYENRVFPPIYILFIFLLLTLLFFPKIRKIKTFFLKNNIILSKHHSNELKKINTGFILSISFSFLISLLIYLLAYFIIGNKYQVWKFASFTSLPLSFVPFSLLISAITLLWRSKKKLISVIVLLTLFLYWSYSAYCVRPILGLYKKLYIVDSSLELYNIFKYIYDSTPNDTNLVLYLKDYASALIFSELYKNQTTRKLNLLVPLPNFSRVSDLNILLNKKILLVSDRKFSNLFNSERGSTERGQIFLLEKEFLYETGFVSTFGVFINDFWEIDKRNIFQFIVNLPENLLEKKIKLTLKLKMFDSNSKQIYQNNNCGQRIRLWVYGSPEPVFGQESSFEVETIVTPELTSQGYFSTTGKIIVPDKFQKNENCSSTFVLDKIEVEEAKNY
jgi:hypothetical protein